MTPLPPPENSQGKKGKLPILNKWWRGTPLLVKKTIYFRFSFLKASLGFTGKLSII